MDSATFNGGDRRLRTALAEMIHPPLWRKQGLPLHGRPLVMVHQPRRSGYR
jgi:hypothetical protein